MPGIPTPGAFATSWASIGPGSKTAAPKTATGEPCGRWANARGRMPARHGADGRRPCLPRHCRPSQAFRSPRALAFTLLGLDAYCAVAPDDQRAREIRHSLADTLMSALASVETPDWVWFEEGLAYDNARLPQALIADRHGNANARLCRCRFEIPALADDAANDVDRAFPPGGHRRLRRTATSLPGPSISSRWKPPQRLRRA